MKKIAIMSLFVLNLSCTKPDDTNPIKTSNAKISFSFSYSKTLELLKNIATIPVIYKGDTVFFNVNISSDVVINKINLVYETFSQNSAIIQKVENFTPSKEIGLTLPYYLDVVDTFFVKIQTVDINGNEKFSGYLNIGSTNPPDYKNIKIYNEIYTESGVYRVNSHYLEVNDFVNPIYVDGKAEPNISLYGFYNTTGYNAYLTSGFVKSLISRTAVFKKVYNIDYYSITNFGLNNLIDVYDRNGYKSSVDSLEVGDNFALIILNPRHKNDAPGKGLLHITEIYESPNKDAKDYIKFDLKLLSSARSSK